MSTRDLDARLKRLEQRHQPPPPPILVIAVPHSESEAEVWAAHVAGHGVAADAEHVTFKVRAPVEVPAL